MDIITIKYLVSFSFCYIYIQLCHTDGLINGDAPQVLIFVVNFITSLIIVMGKLLKLAGSDK